MNAVLHLSSPVLSPTCRLLLLLLSIFAHDFSFYLEGYFIDHLFSSAITLAAWVKADLMDIKNLGPDSPDDDPDENLETDQYPDPNKSKAEG